MGLSLTLHFIGAVDGGIYEDICESLADLKGDEFELKLSGIGFFPPRKAPQVLWVGVEKNEYLVQLRNRIGSALRRSGVELEKRKFSPHITVARLRNSPPKKLATFLVAHNLYKSTSIKISKFKLYSSVLTQNGAMHAVEAEYMLGCDTNLPVL